MKNKSVFTFIFTIFFLLFIPSGVFAQSNSFRFVSWGDTKSGRSALASLSNQAKLLNPVLTIYTGDLESDGFTASGMALWKNAVNGGSSPGNGMFDITFPVRGNHDSSNTSGWQSYFNMQAMAQRIGATNYTELSTDLTYSFDYGNSHFIGVDVPGSGSMISSAQTAWMDSDLAAAEGRGLTHAFINFHGPIYYVDDHSSSVPGGLITVMNKHPIVSATFHGHEHVDAYVHLDSSRISTITHPFEEFVTGRSGASSYNCASNRSDYCANYNGFATVDVNGNSFTVKFYEQGNNSSKWTKTFTKPGGSTPQLTPTPTRSASPTPTPPSFSGCSRKSQGDANCDGVINGVDYSLWLNNQCTKTASSPCTYLNADFNSDGNVDNRDYTIWFEQRG